jgi:mono/diheme cytochrome c family protein
MNKAYVGGTNENPCQLRLRNVRSRRIESNSTGSFPGAMILARLSRMRPTTFGIIAAALMFGISATSGCSNGQSATAPGPTAANVDFKTLKNTVEPTSKSLESGKRLYDRLCAECHGTAGDGISEMASILVKSGKIAPSNLTDDTWDLGSTDGEIFKVIRDGSGSNLAMKGLNGRPGIVDEDIWNLVNYVRSLHK